MTAAYELAGLVRVPVYEWRGPNEEYVLVQTLETGNRPQQAAEPAVRPDRSPLQR